MFSTNKDFKTYQEGAKSKAWRRAIDLEIESIENNGTWELGTLSKALNTIGVKWLYKTKYIYKGEVYKPIERLMAKGYS